MTELTYTKNGDYRIPDLKLSEEPQSKPLGKYGMLRKTYLQEHRPILWNQMILSETLFPHLREIDESANNRLFSDVPEFRNHLHQEVFEGTYERLHDLLRPLSQDDIDDALRAWNGNVESKHAVARYMEQHGRERETAACDHRADGGCKGRAGQALPAGGRAACEIRAACRTQRRAEHRRAHAHGAVGR